MAVTRTGSILEYGWGTNSGTQATTVPADAELIVVSVSGYYGGSSYISQGTLKLNSVDMIKSATYDTCGSDNQHVVIWTLKNPSTGSQSLAWDWYLSDAPSEGLNVFVAFYKGIDTTTPIKDEGGDCAKGTTQKTTGSMTAASGDMVVAVADVYTGGSFTWSASVTKQADTTYRSDVAEFAEGTPSGDVTVTFQSDESYSAFAAIVIAAAAGGGETYNESVSDGVKFGDTRAGSISVSAAMADGIEFSDTGDVFAPTLSASQVGDDIVLTWTMPGD